MSEKKSLAALLIDLLRRLAAWLTAETERDFDDANRSPAAEVERAAESGSPQNEGDHDKPKEDKMRIAISSGHGAKIPGAVGLLVEVREARRVTRRVAQMLREAGAEVAEFHDDDSETVAANINSIVGWHNAHERDMDVSVHFNAFRPTDGPMGAEVLYLSAREAAAKVSAAIAAAGGFRDRGARHRTDLGFLNRTGKPAILLEVCFVDSAADARLFGESFDGICAAIARSLRECLESGGR